MRNLVLLLAAAASAVVMSAGAARAQSAGADEVEAVVVTARRIGVPVWRVQGSGSTLVLVGQIQGVPDDADWNKAALDRAVERADAVVFPHDIRGSPADVVRLLWRIRSFAFLPKGRTLADYLDANTHRRVQALRASGVIDDDGDEEQMHPWLVANDILDHAETGGLLGKDVVSDAVAQAVRKHGKKRENVGVQGAGRLIDVYMRGPETHIACLQAALDVADAGPGAARERVKAWTERRVIDVVSSPAEKALDRCWPYAAASAQLRADWRKTLDGKLAQRGVTLAVVPTLYLAESGGILDGFKARGLPVDGPRWRADQP